MNAGVLDALGWTPERGVLSAEDGLGSLCRFSRTCVAVVEQLWTPEVNPVVVGTATGVSTHPGTVLEELGRRWPRASVELVVGGAQTLPASFMEASFALEDAETVLWVVVELQPGAELCSAFRLSRRASTFLELTRASDSVDPVAPHLNPCAGAVVLADAFGDEGVSVRVASWSISLRASG